MNSREKKGGPKLKLGYGFEPKFELETLTPPAPPTYSKRLKVT